MLRQITVANTKTQKRDKFECDVETLGQLKKELDARGIDYSGMSFTEGLSKTILTDDASILPSNLPYKDQRTNNLVILLTNTEKKISSGADRKALYAAVKEHNLQEQIQKKFGKNYTNVGSDDLEKFVNNALKKGGESAAPAPKEEPKKEEPKKETPKKEEPSKTENGVSEGLKENLIETIVNGLTTLMSKSILNQDDLNKIAGAISTGEAKEPTTEENLEISDDDIESMIKDAKKCK